MPSNVDGRIMLSFGNRARWWIFQSSSCRTALRGLDRKFSGLTGLIVSAILPKLGGCDASMMNTVCADCGGSAWWSLSIGERSLKLWTILTLIV